MTKKLLIAALALGATAAAQAQKGDQFLSLSAGGGFHQLGYSIDNGSRKGGAGYTLGAGYTYFFSPNWGISTGVGAQSFKSTSTLNLLTKAPNVDAEGDAYELRTRYSGWKEEQSATLIDIPLAATYRRALTTKVGLTASAGAKLSIPAKSTYKATGGSITTTGYYSQWKAELGDLPEQGLSTYSQRPSGDISLRPSVALLADAGATYLLNDAISLYGGIYASYGLNSMLKADSKNIYLKEGIYNGLFESSQVDKVKPLALGVKLGVVWNFRH
ncbi:outer membrane beta-barrel protein [uncultured Acetobacteroides sp.]|uniref:outer membrane beta-barrel protein n=1 Tax=uncultured Acetobacteroides sp. TaxID=1760811 RepID=UPI0029F5C47E|nr:outer membrane beta-barrel protein [uncultured Acetobacteroides sp.]